MRIPAVKNISTIQAAKTGLKKAGAKIPKKVTIDNLPVVAGTVGLLTPIPFASVALFAIGKAIQLTIKKIHTFHDEQKGILRGPNIIHILSDGKKKIAHFGDIGCSLTEEQEELLSDLDLDAVGAKNIIDKVRPKIVVPMHYRGNGFGFDVIDTMDPFLKLCDRVNVIDGSSVEITKDLEGQTLVLSPQNWKS